jgi:hypothetical protein
MELSPQESELNDQIKKDTHEGYELMDTTPAKPTPIPINMKLSVPDGTELQKVFLTFADGRIACFIGPKVISALEMVRPPRLVRIDFSEPFTAGPTKEGEPNGEANAASVPSAGNTAGAEPQKSEG